MRAILFDLDGTLLDLDTAEFMGRYFRAIRAIPTPGWTGELLDSVAIATEEMLGRHPGRTNADVFWERFEQVTARPREQWEPVFEEFYATAFPRLQQGAGPSDGALRAFGAARTRGLTVVIATNPMFPRVAVDHRLAWAGLADLPADVLVTSFETSTACKPWPEYFSEVADRIGIAPSDCLMVGDDPSMDLGSRDAGMKAWLLDEPPAGRTTDYVGSLDQLADLIDRL
jgi:FMN phosphatase YigB (HAD superfamily)